jgi:peptidoglycan L-alanyl-D-glutamate endopeptidase CwlK
MSKRYLFFFLLFLVAALCGCVARLSGVSMPYGSLRNPIIDSDITLAQALRKYSPPDIQERQRLIDVLYYSFDGKIHKGQVVIDARLVADIRKVFRVAFKNKFPIGSVIPISHDKFYRDGKWNDDNQSMLSNNSAGFNYRKVTGGTNLSMHRILILREILFCRPGQHTIQT